MKRFGGALVNAYALYTGELSNNQVQLDGHSADAPWPPITHIVRRALTTHLRRQAMAKANLTLPDGTRVLIEGTAEEVATLLAKCSQPTIKTRKIKQKQRAKSATTSKAARKAKKGPVGYITELVDEGFFKTKRTLPEIQKKLEEQGHIYAQTSLSPALLNLTKKRALRRIKEKKNWVYVHA